MRLVTEYIALYLIDDNSQHPTARSQATVTSHPSTVVLFSSGLDRAVLAVSEARRGRVHPVYVSAGLAWEREELAAVDRLLASPAYRDLAPIARLNLLVADVVP